MKRVRLDRWAQQIQPPRNPRLPSFQQCPFSSQSSRGLRRDQHSVQCLHQPRWTSLQHDFHGNRRHASTATATSPASFAEEEFDLDADFIPPPLNAPSHTRATSSAKLSALHARLSLPAKLPLQSLARCLVDQSVDPRPGHSNAPLAILGSELLGLYTAEWLICNYPRLPMPVIFAAQYAYIGEKTLSSLRREWGVEAAAYPGAEVDPGLLQYKRVIPGNALGEDGQSWVKDARDSSSAVRGTGRSNETQHYRRGTTSRIVYDDQFGDLKSGLDAAPYPGAPISIPGARSTFESAAVEPGTKEVLEQEDASSAEPELVTSVDGKPTTLDAASGSFVRAVAGAVYLHAGQAAAKAFHSAHILSRQLALHTLFAFEAPTRDLSRLCAREGFEPPVARLLSETGRLSRSPVFVVGVYSGNDKLGEGAGSSLDEARIRAAAAALRGWYLYSPPEEDVMLPSDVNSDGKVGPRGREWKAQMVDQGEIIT